MTSAPKGEGRGNKCPKFGDRFCGERGKEGVKNPKLLWTSYMEAPKGKNEAGRLRILRNKACGYVDVDVALPRVSECDTNQHKADYSIHQTTTIGILSVSAFTQKVGTKLLAN